MAARDTPTHAAPIKSLKQLVAVIALSFSVPILAISLLAVLVTSGIDVDSESETQSPESVAARTRPVAEVAVGEPAIVEKGQRGGEQIVKQVCAACHETGAANAPKIGDKAAWGKLIAEGHKRLVAEAIKGVRAMPPRGGDATLTDDEVSRAVAFMANKAGANFQEPPVKTAAAKAAAK